MDSNIISPFAADLGAIQPQHFTRFPKYTVRMAILCLESSPHHRKPKFPQPPTAPYRGNGVVCKQNPNSGPMGQYPRSPPCPCPCPAAASRGFPGSPERDCDIWSRRSHAQSGQRQLGAPGSQAVSEKPLEPGEHLGRSQVRSESSVVLGW